jgi:transposase
MIWAFCFINIPTGYTVFLYLIYTSHEVSVESSSSGVLMPAALSVTPHLSLDQLRERYHSCDDASLKIRWQVVLLRAEGHSPAFVQDATKMSASTVLSWVQRYNERGPEGLPDGRATNGKPPYLDATQQAELKQVLLQEPPDGGLWSGPKVAIWIRTRLQRPEIHEECGGKYLRRLQFSPKRPRPAHPKADRAAQDTFKKKTLPSR